MKSMSILFVGDTTPFLTTAARRDAFRELGLPVETIDPRDFVQSPHRLLTSLAFWTLLTPSVQAYLISAQGQIRGSRTSTIAGTKDGNGTNRFRCHGSPLISDRPSSNPYSPILRSQPLC